MANGNGTVDYDALARQYGASSPAIDYDALAKQHGAISSTPPPSINAQPTDNASFRAAPAIGSRAWLKEKGIQALESATNALPAAGATVGGIIGGISAPISGPFAPLNVVGGAALGGAGGEAAREAIRQRLGWDAPTTLGQTAKSVGYQGALQGTVAAGGELAGAGAALGLQGLKNTLNVATPAEQQAVQFGLSRGIPVDVATATGNKFLKGVQAGTEYGPVGAYVRGKAVQAQAKALSRVGGELAEEASPGMAQVPESAGQGVKDALAARISALKQQADDAYTGFRSIVNSPNNVKTVTVGQQAGTSPLLDEFGRPTVTTTPITKQVATPVDMRSIKQQLQPMYDRMSTWMQPALRDASQGYQAMQSIVNGPDFVPASEAEAGLGGLKSLAREATGPDTANVSQGIAKFSGQQLQDQIDAAVNQHAGPAALKALQTGRALHAQKMITADTLQSLSDEPVRAFRSLAMAKDAGIEQLRQVGSLVPGQMPNVGRAYIEDLMNRATAEGGFNRAQGLYSDWQNLGPETKKMLFPNPQLRQNLDNFFLLAKRLGESPNPSGTALTSSALGQTALMFAHPTTGIPLVLGGGALSKMMRSATAVRALTDTMSAAAPAAIKGSLSAADKGALATLIGNVGRMAYKTGARDVYQGQQAQGVMNAPPVIPQAAPQPPNP